MDTLPDTLYANVLLALDRKDWDLLFRLWRESLGMGGTGNVLRTLIKNKVPDFEKEVQDYHWQKLSEMYVQHFDSLVDFAWDKYYANLFVGDSLHSP